MRHKLRSSISNYFLRYPKMGKDFTIQEIDHNLVIGFHQSHNFHPFLHVVGTDQDVEFLLGMRANRANQIQSLSIEGFNY